MIFFTKSYSKCDIRREHMYNVKKKKSLEILYSVMAQLSVIMALFVWLFAIAPFSYGNIQFRISEILVLLVI